MSVKIQINSLAALERLIGGDSELEIEVRNSVVQNFTKKYLKDVANSKTVELQGRLIREEIKNSVLEKPSYGFVKEHLTVDTVESIRQSVRTCIQNIVREEVTDIIAKKELTKKVEEAVQVTVEYITKQLGPSILSRRIDELVEARLKERLGIK